MTKLYNINEAAYILGVCDHTVREWIKDGKLKAVLLRGSNGYASYQIKEDDIEECLLNHTQHALEVINRFYSRREKERYLQSLDAREEELYEELCVLEEMRQYCKGLEL